jgi:hypothetical protein
LLLSPSPLPFPLLVLLFVFASRVVLSICWGRAYVAILCRGCGALCISTMDMYVQILGFCPPLIARTWSVGMDPSWQGTGLSHPMQAYVSLHGVCTDGYVVCRSLPVVLCLVSSCSFSCLLLSCLSCLERPPPRPEQRSSDERFAPGFNVRGGCLTLYRVPAHTRAYGTQLD